MVTVSREIASSPDAVWAVVSDGWLYPSWVVGASRMRHVDPAWPAVGARLHHSVGVWPALLDDTTSVVSSVPGKELVLEARGWPFGEATVRLTIEARPSGCLVAMAEDATSGPGKLIPGPVRTALIGPRNTESLRRLAYLAENGSR
ncbi:SRPBCC family protein [Pseudonocardia zijingensis]|uniref:SRPBCC family protein n=1 Tax=Pseudonocardia zijingensis TaxID=153376 RepID=A0ABP4AXF2_9PSEU